MPTQIAMPSLGMVMTEGTIARWLASDGATVAKGEPVVEIETDKLTHEIGAPAEGLLHRVAAEGTVLPVEGLIAWILAPGEAPPAPPAATEHGRTTAAVAPLALGWPTPSAAPAGLASGVALLPGSPLVGPSVDVPVSPAARRLAREHGVELGSLHGSGPGRRIVEADVRAALAAARPASASAAPPAPLAPPRAASVAPSAVARAAPPVATVPPRASIRASVASRTLLTGMRKVIADRMTASLATGAQLTLTREVDASALVAARAARTSSLTPAPPYDAFFARALAAALTEAPTLNASVEGDEVVTYATVNVGVAVALPSGLVVPVVRDAAARTLVDLARQLAELTARARAGRLTPDDLADGTVTITNLGAQGIDVFTPILNPPQSAILGIGRIAPRAVVVSGDAVAVRPTVHLSLTFDHRVTDGVPAAELLARVAALIGDPGWLRSL